MIRPHYFALACVLVAMLTAARFVRADDAADVRACFDAYKKAILAQDGKAAGELVDSRTLAYYGRMRDAALKTPAAEVRKLPMLDRLMIVTIRHRVPADKIAAMSDKEMFIHGVDEGWIGKESVQKNELGEITVTGESAKGVHLTAGRKTPLSWKFYKEDGAWKLNLTEVLPTVETAFKKLAADSGQNEDDFIVFVLGLVSGKKVADSVWEPLAP